MDICSIYVYAKTKSKIIPYTAEFCEISPLECLVYENKQLFSALCAAGCKNYNKKWSCPPNAPSFSAIAKTWKYFYVMFLHMSLSEFNDVKNPYLRLKAANSILKSRADRYMSMMAFEYGKYISTGSCRLCRPCKCKMGKPCAHPTKMAYSLEALGINVDALIYHCFNKHLLWYKHGSIPEYTSVVCGLLSNENLTFDILKTKYLKIIGQ